MEQLKNRFSFVERGRVLEYPPCSDLQRENQERLALGQKPIKYKELRRKNALFVRKNYNHIQVVVKDRAEMEQLLSLYHKMFGKGLYVFVTSTGHVIDYVIRTKTEQLWFKNRQSMLDKSVLLGFRAYNAPQSVKMSMMRYRDRMDAWNTYINK